MIKLKESKIRPFIKWPGSKYRFLNFILAKLPIGKVLIEPFVGSGAIFLNTNYESYILSDANSDLINLYKTLQQYGDEFINFCNKFFISKNNTAIQYYKIRDQFNNMEQDQDQDLITRAALFLYLNRQFRVLLRRIQILLYKRKKKRKPQSYKLNAQQNI